MALPRNNAAPPSPTAEEGQTPERRLALSPPRLGSVPTIRASSSAGASAPAGASGRLPPFLLHPPEPKGVRFFFSVFLTYCLLTVTYVEIGGVRHPSPDLRAPVAREQGPSRAGSAPVACLNSSK